MATEDVVEVFGPIIPIPIDDQCRVVNRSQNNSAPPVGAAKGDYTMQNGTMDRAAFMVAKAKEFDGEPTLLELVSNKRSYIDGCLIENKMPRTSDEEFLAVSGPSGTPNADRMAVINRLGAKYDGSRELQAVCTDRASYVSGTMISMGLPKLSERESANVNVMQWRRL